MISSTQSEFIMVAIQCTEGPRQDNFFQLLQSSLFNLHIVKETTVAVEKKHLVLVSCPKIFQQELMFCGNDSNSGLEFVQK